MTSFSFGLSDVKLKYAAILFMYSKKTFVFNDISFDFDF